MDWKGSSLLTALVVRGSRILIQFTGINSSKMYDSWALCSNVRFVETARQLPIFDSLGQGDHFLSLLHEQKIRNEGPPHHFSLHFETTIEKHLSCLLQEHPVGHEIAGKFAWNLAPLSDRLLQGISHWSVNSTGIAIHVLTFVHVSHVNLRVERITCFCNEIVKENKSHHRGHSTQKHWYSSWFLNATVTISMLRSWYNTTISYWSQSNSGAYIAPRLASSDCGQYVVSLISLLFTMYSLSLASVISVICSLSNLWFDHVPCCPQKFSYLTNLRSKSLMSFFFELMISFHTSMNHYNKSLLLLTKIVVKLTVLHSLESDRVNFGSSIILEEYFDLQNCDLHLSKGEEVTSLHFL